MCSRNTSLIGIEIEGEIGGGRRENRYVVVNIDDKMEWKSKKDLGRLGGVRRTEKAHIERSRELDAPHYVDLRAASSIYFIETRARVQDVVVREPSFRTCQALPGL